MINQLNQENLQFIWQAIWWRVVLTALLLALLAGSSATLFSRTTNPASQVLPSLVPDSGVTTGVDGAGPMPVSIP